MRVPCRVSPHSPAPRRPGRKEPPGPGGPKPVVKPAPVKTGYVLTHEHPTYGMAFGGNYAFAGAQGNYRNGIMENGYTAECGGCKALSGCDHGEVKGNIIAATGSLGSDMGDHKSHKGPLHDSNSHLRYSTQWIKDAHKPTEAEFKDSRMRIMVAFAVENESMCEQLYYANKGKGGAGGDGYPCSKGDSLESLERQLDALKAWAKANSAWTEIAYSSADARRIIGADKLAVILGIESEYSFGAEDRTFDPVDRLKRYYDKGVRTFYLAHKINSRLAGADIYYPKDTVAGKTMRATQAIAGCFYYDDNVGPFPLTNDQGFNFCDNKCGDNFFKGNKLGGLSDKCASKFSEISEVNMADYLLLRGETTFNGFNIYPLPPGFKGSAGSRMDGTIQRNNLSLSHDGERVVREAMTKGMIVNIDHVSSDTRKEIYAIATQSFGGYPLNALHNNPNALLKGAGTGAFETPDEYDFDDRELKYINDTGGFFGIRVGPFDAKKYDESGVTADCPKTATETAKFIAYLVRFGLNVGYALDYATVTQGVQSRTMRECGANLGTDYLHKYGAEIAEGLSHIGMMKAWHKELETVGLKPEYLDKAKNDGAAAFVAMWESPRRSPPSAPRSRGRASPTPSAGAPPCTEDSDCGSGKYCGDPVLGKRTCKALKAQGEACTQRLPVRHGQSLPRAAPAPTPTSARRIRTARATSTAATPSRASAAARPSRARATAAPAAPSAPAATASRCSAPTPTSASPTRTARATSTAATPSWASAPARTSSPRATAARRPSSAPRTAAPAASAPTPTSARPTPTARATSTAATPSRANAPARCSQAHGVGCTSASQCASDRCSWGFCADADECRSNGDCVVGEYCGDPIAGKAKCKDLLADGKACTKGIQCKSGKCSFFKCRIDPQARLGDQGERRRGTAAPALNRCRAPGAPRSASRRGRTRARASHHPPRSRPRRRAGAAARARQRAGGAAPRPSRPRTRRVAAPANGRRDARARWRDARARRGSADRPAAPAAAAPRRSAPRAGSRAR